jgi:hypothetical protein
MEQNGQNTPPAREIDRLPPNVNRQRRRRAEPTEAEREEAQALMDRIMTQINSVIRCKLNECKLCCMDRDINASKNILLLLQLQQAGKKRPECFSPKNMNDYDTLLWEDKYVVA